ncbi:tetraacyldisaccharide 4'-kinase [Pelobacter propionicus]|uniref:Tetraacyldisaccharide 4'-kinase n=1 Tax=Pelobacter propionicus (strain DSM 2379 / NBRC 103807 / OttBd1) TaxID=338966 RepID=LPXK_PELPD|nr:tetraacyldisaccharide 4'-kinase [Pelobacter propionicus]A1ATF5.1 RecName: Full=Tetraacyldisaccharide 4'-kinase; AltName: Full=Lipid A 4'-kinase [Pelobacter propionicus DSM 2379]ABL00626.1 lipid-A-disaccharide kinase [Pelobacter propionicus DSM 2379]
MNSSLATYWRALASGTRRSLPDRSLLSLLVPFSLLYALIQRLRAVLYRVRLLKSRRLPRPVISVGNLTVGGTGKTPVTAHIARWLLAEGYRVAVLSRGYGGSLEGHTAVVSDGRTVMMEAEQCGDEPFLLSSTIPGLMVVMGSDRFSAGMLAMEQLAPDVFLLDDGYQHLRLTRDLNILLLDHALPFGNGWTLPAGVLREPTSAAGRADLVIRTRCPRIAPCPSPLPGIPSCTARHSLGNVIPLGNGAAFPMESLRGRRVLAFAGIADPYGFFEELREQGLNLVAELAMPDHVAYDDNRIAEIGRRLHGSGAEFAVTTEKDGVKLLGLQRECAEKILLARLELIIADPAPLTDALRNLLQK